MRRGILWATIAGTAILSFRAWGCVPVKLLTESAESASVSIAPKLDVVPAGQSLQFVASVFRSTNTAVEWSVNGVPGGNSAVGTITVDGIYSAPATIPAPPAAFILAVLRANRSKSDTATAIIVKPGTGQANQARQQLPIKLGTSGGNTRDLGVGTTSCCAGTLGSLVDRGGVKYILSNNHVLTRWEQAANDEPISQPGLVDTDCNANGSVVAHLSQWQPVRSSNVDAALAQVVPGAVDPLGAILEFGPVVGGTIQAAPPANTIINVITDPAQVMGLRVAKSGRTTGLTCAPVGAITIIANVKVNSTTSCNSGNSFSVIFTNQMVVNSIGFSVFGDSGSLIVNAGTAQPVALLFAASSTLSLGNPIQDVLTALRDPASGAVPTFVGGGTHPIACPSSAAAAAQAPSSALSDGAMAAAIQAEAKYANGLMADPAVLGVEVGRSDDDPGAPAVVLYLEPGKQHAKIPAELDGVRTKLIFTKRFPSQSAKPQAAEVPERGLNLSPDELSRVAEVKQRHSERMLADPAIVGIGVGASNDNPEEAAVVLFVSQSAPVPRVPAQIDGARTKVVITDEFRAFGSKQAAANSCRNPSQRRR